MSTAKETAIETKPFENRMCQKFNLQRVNEPKCVDANENERDGIFYCHYFNDDYFIIDKGILASLLFTRVYAWWVRLHSIR